MLHGKEDRADEVAAVMEFLLSDDASFVTSSLYTVEGSPRKARSASIEVAHAALSQRSAIAATRSR
jgi:hypothetical protein